MSFMRKLHKWLGLIVGLQVAAWVLSGAVMSVLDHHVVSGEITAAEQPVAPAMNSGVAFVEPAALASANGLVEVSQMRLSNTLGRWVWRVQARDAVALYDALDGTRVEIGPDEIWQIATSAYAGSGSIVAVERLAAPTIEARGHELPLWRVRFDDRHGTRLYIDGNEGSVVERRTDAWTVFDFFWMLHTMDYAGRDDFNTPWVVLAALAALWLALSGTFLLVKSFRR
jgi:hypothetical protein